MDCPSEESLIRMKLEGSPGIRGVSFDLEKRELAVIHDSEVQQILKTLDQLDFGTSLIESGPIDLMDQRVNEGFPDEQKLQKKMLWWVLGINAGFFVLEIMAGILAGSMGLVADSLDMLADAMVYGLSLWAVGSFVKRKKLVASLAGYIQLVLALGGFAEVIRRFVTNGDMPDFRVMILVAFLALLANTLCLYLLQKTKSRDAHMKASMIFTSNDIIINVGVIVAGFLVLLTQSDYPDLIVGALVFIIVLRGAFRIIKLGRS